MNSQPQPGSYEDHARVQKALRRVYELGGEEYAAGRLAEILNYKTGLNWTAPAQDDVRNEVELSGFEVKYV